MPKIPHWNCGTLPFFLAINLLRLNMLSDDNPFASEDITPPFNDEWSAKRRVADAIKQLTEVLVTSSPSIEKMHAIAEQLEATSEDFRKSPRIFGRGDWAQNGDHGSFGQISHELNPMAGWSNPIAPPLNSWIDGDAAFAACQCGWAYEGPPGSVHGGFVAAIFDQFLGMSQMIGGQPGMTAYLHVNYHVRTPLNTPLKLEARIVKIEGRKTIVRGEMFAEGIMTASAEGLFVQPRGGMHAVKTQVAAKEQD
ncbi:MAG: PaaI family thioesterase [Halioglobus sp.]|nr:PaaI family thioesterase [Halioglobus sp.]